MKDEHALLDKELKKWLKKKTKNKKYRSKMMKTQSYLSLI